MRKLFYACFAALMMLLASTGWMRAQLVLSFELYGAQGDQYGMYVPFKAKLTSAGVEQQNFEVYYTLAGAPPTKDLFQAGEEANTGVYRSVATNGFAEIILAQETAPFQAVAYLPNSATASNTVSKSLTALAVEKPSFNPPAPQLGKVQVTPNSTVRIIDEAGGADIYYSMDGETTPLESLFGANPNVFKYDDETGVKVTKDVLIWAIAFKTIDGNLGGSEKARISLEMDNKPQVQLSLNVNDVWNITQPAPVLTVTALGGATLGTAAGNVAVKLNFSITGNSWTQIITENNTALDMSKAIAAAKDDWCSITCSLVKGNATNEKVQDVVIEPEVMGFQIDVPGEKPVKPVFRPAGGTILKGSTVTLECATEGAEIYYILDKDDAPPSVKYTKPITVSRDCVIHADARKGGKSSDRVTAIYAVTDDPSKVDPIIPDDPTPETLEAPTISVASGEVEAGTPVTITCAQGAEIRYTTDGTEPTAASTLYETAVVVNEAMTLKAIAVKGELTSTVATAVYTIKPATDPDDPTPETLEAPVISVASGEVEAGTPVTITCAQGAEIRYTTDGTEPTAASTLYETAVVVNEAMTLKAIAVKGELTSTVATAVYTIKPATDPDDPTPEKVELTFYPVSGATVNDGTAVSISSRSNVDIFYMMFGSEEAARAAEWNQDEALSYNLELRPVLSPENNTIKAAYVRQGSMTLGEEFFYATYTVNTLSGITLTFNPVSGSVVEDGATVTVTADGDVDIYYNTYASKAAADADDEPFVFNSKMVAEDGMPVITKGKTFLRCAVFNGSTMVYFDASYRIKGETPDVTFTFNPASGSEVEDGTAITITPSDATVEIFYMMFGSEVAAKAAAWDQDKAASYNNELKPVLSKEYNTLKVAYAFAGAEAVEAEFFYATYKIAEQSGVTLTFNPASGSEVEDGTAITVTASRKLDIYYNVYADKAAADADAEFINTAGMVAEDGMPVITKGKTFLRCAVFDGKMRYFDAAYTVNTANEDVELTGVNVYPNPSDGIFYIELPEAATVDVFMSNGALFRSLKLGAGVKTLNIKRSGIYFLRIAGENRTTIKRIIVR